MPHDITLPEIFPVDDIIVRDEEYLFEVFQGDSGPLPKTEYTLDKAPINRVRSVTGTLNGTTGYEFTKGSDYELSEDNEDIVWLSNDRPDAGTTFFVTYTTESILSRYIASSSEEFDSVEDEMVSAIQSKFLSGAEGRELDEIGKLFGNVIGKRRGRDDIQYKIYLQSVVQSFISRGTKTGIKLAVSAATDVPLDDITINENFETNQYEVIVIPNTAVRVSLIETIADIADPSGVEQVRTRFPIFETVRIDDRGGLSPNNVETSESLFTDDTVSVPPVGADIVDSLAADDTNANESTTVLQWDDFDWNDKPWTAEVN